MAKEKRDKKEEPEDQQGKRAEALDRAISHIEKQYGRGSIMRLGSENVLDVPAISTGSLALDIALGVGGVPRGRVMEIFGPEGSGKTTLALHIVANAQKAGGIGAYIDAEHALDTTYARKLGVNVDDLLVHQPEYGEEALDVAEILVRSNATDVVVMCSSFWIGRNRSSAMALAGPLKPKPPRGGSPSC